MLSPRTSRHVSEWLRMSLLVTLLFLMLLPVMTRAAAEPVSDKTSAIRATTIAGEGIKRRMGPLLRAGTAGTLAEHLDGNGSHAGPVVEVDQHQLLPGAELEPPAPD